MYKEREDEPVYQKINLLNDMIDSSRELCEQEITKFNNNKFNALTLHEGLKHFFKNNVEQLSSTQAENVWFYRRFVRHIFEHLDIREIYLWNFTPFNYDEEEEKFRLLSKL